MRSDSLSAKSPWNSLLASLYGSSVAAKAEPDIASLLDLHHPDHGNQIQPWNERDAWLITYPDQFQRGGESALRTLRHFYDTHLSDVLNGIHLLPFFPWSSDDGFSITDYTKVDERYGTWADVESIAEHSRLMIDVVANHLSSGSDWFAGWLEDRPGFEGLFRTAEPATDLSRVVRAREHPLLTRFESASGPRWVWTTFSADQVDLDYRDPRTLLRVLEVLLDYAKRGVDMIRLDAVGFLWKDETTASLSLRETHLVVQFLRACLDVTYPHVLLITETNVPHAENVSYFGADGEREAQAVYQFPLPPLVLHTFLTGDASALSEWAASVDPPSEGTTYLNMLATHDGVGLRPIEGILDRDAVDRLVAATTQSGGEVNRRQVVDGESSPYELNATWFDLVRGSSTDSDAMARHLASHAVLLGLRGVPAIYVHSLFATKNDQGTAARSGEARGINRHKFVDVAKLESQLAEPLSEAAGSLRGISNMLRWRQTSRSFDPEAGQRILDLPRQVVGIERTGPDGSVARVYVNTSPETVRVDNVPGSEVRGWRWSDQDSRIELGPWGAAWLL